MNIKDIFRSRKRKNDREEKLSFSEKRFQDALEFYKLTLTIISTVIVLITIGMGILSYTSKKEVSDAITEMEKRYSKVPELEITYQGRELENQVIEVLTSDSIFLLPKIELFNKGTGQSTYPSINISFGDSIKYIPIRSDVWVNDNSVDLFYKYQYQINISTYDTPDLKVIFPQETDFLPDFKLVIPKSINIVRCKLSIYYENVEASISRFEIKPIWK